MVKRCNCDDDTEAHWDYVSCKGCGQVTVSGKDWGIAAGKYFKDIHDAKFYKYNGRLPEERLSNSGWQQVESELDIISTEIKALRKESEASMQSGYSYITNKAMMEVQVYKAIQKRLDIIHEIVARYK